jgi:alkyl hydroperoxide reductase subunit D
VTYEDLKASIPEFAKDIRLNLDAVILRSSLQSAEAAGVAVAAAYAAGMDVSPFAELAGDQKEAALVAAALMGMNNVWYPYVDMAADDELKRLPVGLRMNAYASHGGTSKERFEAYALAASIVGKCEFCARSHYELLKKNGYTVKQLQDIGRIAAVVAAVAKTLR